MQGVPVIQIWDTKTRGVSAFYPRQRRPVDIELLPVNGQSVLVDMSIDPVNKEVCPVNKKSSCRDDDYCL
jgi:hypothetical protein